MWHIGIDLHRKNLVVAAVDDHGSVRKPEQLSCRDENSILELFSSLQPFRCVVEATETYYWLYEILSPLGTVLLAHTFRLRAMINRRSKTDELDSMLLAQLLRVDLVPLSYIPTAGYYRLRKIMRHRIKIGRDLTKIKTSLKALAARHNKELPYISCYGPKGLAWFRNEDFGMADDIVRDDLHAGFDLLTAQIKGIESCYDSLAKDFPEVTVLTDIHGVGVYSALVIIAEFGDPCRFRHAKQEAALKVTARDERLAAFYTRIRKRSSKNIARVAVARKMAEICWKRLKHFQQTRTA